PAGKPFLTPQVTPARPKRSGRAWQWLMGLAGLGAGAYFWLRPSGNQPVPAAVATIRTATVVAGSVESTLRLTGVTGAKNFVSLITPQLRGSRSDRALGSVPPGSATQTPTKVGSVQGGNTSPGG